MTHPKNPNSLLAPHVAELVDSMKTEIQITDKQDDSSAPAPPAKAPEKSPPPTLNKWWCTSRSSDAPGLLHALLDGFADKAPPEGRQLLCNHRRIMNDAPLYHLHEPTCPDCINLIERMREDGIR